MIGNRWLGLGLTGAMLIALAAGCGSGDETVTDDAVADDAVAAESDEASTDANAADADADTDETAATENDADGDDNSETDSDTDGGGGSDCLVGNWESTDSDVAERFQQVLAQIGGDLLSDMTMTADGTQKLEVRADGTMTNLGEVEVIIGMQGESALSASGVTTVEATWSSQGDQLSVTVTDMIMDMDLTMDGVTVPMDEVPPGSVGGTTTSTFTCTDDTLVMDTLEGGLQLGSEMRRVG